MRQNSKASVAFVYAGANMRSNGRGLIKGLLLALSAFPTASLAQTAEPTSDARDAQEQGTDEGEIVVTGSRLPADRLSFPGSITVIGQEELETQRKVSPDLGSILGLSVPSLGVTSHANINRDQTLRGRTPTVLIDGIPVSTPLRDSNQDLRSLTSSSVQQIEVINGSSSLYGNGGAGGVINYITRVPQPGLAIEAESALIFSATHFDDSLSPSFNATISGSSGGFGFVASGSYENFGLQFDAEGDALPPGPGGSQPGLIQSEIKSGFAKLQYDFGGSRIIASGLIYDQVQNPTISIRNGNVRQGIKTTARSGVDPRQTESPSNRNRLASLAYIHDDILGSRLNVRGYYQDFRNVFALQTNRPTSARPSQSVIESRKWGIRADLDTPLNFIRGNVLWGVDYARDETEQFFLSGETWAPPMDLESVAGFAQVAFPIVDGLKFRGGVRYEENTVDVPDFRTFQNIPITGAVLKFSAAVFNGGLTYEFAPGMAVFGGYSEGSSVADLGRLLRDLTRPTSVEQVDPQAVVVDTLEVGARLRRAGINVEIAAYINRSQFGTQLIANPSDPSSFIALQQDEVVKGIEASVGADITRSLRFSGTIAYLEGERDDDGDGKVDTPKDNTDIPPLKITGALDWNATEKLRLRLQGLHSGSRDPYPGRTGNEVLNEGRNDSFTVFDAFGSYDLGFGTFTLGVQNLFNEKYFARYGQSRNRSDSYYLAPGTTVRLSLSMRM